LSAGYFDLAPPFYQGVYEMNHLGNAASLQANTEYRFYQSGHIVIMPRTRRSRCCTTMVAFIRRASNFGH